MKHITVKLTNIKWDEEDGLPQSERVMLPRSYHRMPIGLEDDEGADEMLGQVLDNLTEQFGYLVKHVDIEII